MASRRQDRYLMDSEMATIKECATSLDTAIVLLQSWALTEIARY
jgi:hypothetical protein